MNGLVAGGYEGDQFRGAFFFNPAKTLAAVIKPVA
jgi:hypothetical protein